MSTVSSALPIFVFTSCTSRRKDFLMDSSENPWRVRSATRETHEISTRLCRHDCSSSSSSSSSSCGVIHELTDLVMFNCRAARCKLIWKCSSPHTGSGRDSTTYITNAKCCTMSAVQARFIFRFGLRLGSGTGGGFSLTSGGEGSPRELAGSRFRLSGGLVAGGRGRYIFL